MAVGVTLPTCCGQPPGSGVPAGLALAGGMGSTTLARTPLATKLLGAAALTLASSKQLAAGTQRSSVKAKA